MITFFLNFGVDAGQRIEANTYKSDYLVRADSLLKIKEYDKAIVQYFLASEHGMTQDSLYYFWSELYLQKGDLDSALAANSFALKKTTSTTALEEQLYFQRYSIYVFLGADSLATDTQKKISNLSNKKETKFKASVKLNVSLKYEPEKIRASTLSYWSYDKDSINNEFSGLLRLTGNFQFLLPPESISNFSFGPYFWLKKSSNLSCNVSSALDSLNFDFGSYFSLDNLFKTVRVELKSGINFDRYFAKRWVNGLSYSYVNTKGTFFAAGGYNIAVKKHLNYDYQFGYQAFVMDIKGKSNISISPSLTVSYFGSKHDALCDSTLSSLSLLYFDNSKTNETMVPLFYKDSEMKNSLDTTGLNSSLKTFYFNGYIDQMQQNNIPVTAILDIPLDYFRIDPGVSVDISLKEWRFRPGVRFNLDIYKGLCRWHDFNFDNLTPFIAVDPSTNNYYQITGLNSRGSVDLANFGVGEITGTLFTHKRIDSGIQGEFSIRRKFKKAGVFNLSFQVGKYWTTLPSSCPVSINSWTAECKCDWDFKHSFTKDKIKNEK